MNIEYSINDFLLINYICIIFLLRKIFTNNYYWGLFNASVGSFASILILNNVNYINIISCLLTFNLAYLINDIYFHLFAVLKNYFHHVRLQFHQLIPH